jgi:hypothetical protein
VCYTNPERMDEGKSAIEISAGKVCDVTIYCHSERSAAQ